MTDSFKTFPPEPLVVTISGEAIELTPVRLGELPRLLKVVKVLASDLSSEPDWMALLAEQGEPVLELLALTTRRDRPWINQLSLQDAVQLAAAVFEVNADFFVAQVVPAIQGAAHRLAPTLRSLTKSDGTAPSPG